MNLIILTLVLIVLFGGVGYGYRGAYPNGPYVGGGLGLVLVIVLIYLLMGR